MYKKLFELGRSMGKFGTVSLVASLVDFLAFTFLLYPLLSIFQAEIASAFLGMLVNFFMQKRFVFTLNRKLSSAFMLSILFSFIIMFLGAFVLEELVTYPIFMVYPLLAKLLVMGGKFVVNFFSKRWIFEKR